MAEHKVVPLTPKEHVPQPPQEKDELPEFCTHVACSHTDPDSGTDLRDNVDLLLAHITALFEALEAEDAGLAGLGVDLCAELRRRIDLLGNAHHYFE